jgi:fatty acid desaturase
MAEDAVFPIKELRVLSKASNACGTLDLVLNWGGILAAFTMVVVFPEWYVYVGAAVLISTRQIALANLVHDAWHGLCFAPRPLNDWIGTWLYAYPIGISFFHDRQRHLQHHQLVGRHADPDWVNYSNDGRGSRGRLVLFLVGRLLGSLFVVTVWSVLFKGRARIALQPDAAAPQTSRHEFLKIALCQILLIGLCSLTVGWWGYLLLWLLPLSTLTAFCNSLRAFLEHASHEDEIDPEARIFDVSAGPVERLFVSPCHFHFHALHHAYPSIPHHRLPAAKAALAAVNGGYPFPVEAGYVRVLVRHFRRLGAGPGDPSSGAILQGDGPAHVS